MGIACIVVVFSSYFLGFRLLYFSTMPSVSGLSTKRSSRMSDLSNNSGAGSITAITVRRLRRLSTIVIEDTTDAQRRKMREIVRMLSVSTGSSSKLAGKSSTWSGDSPKSLLSTGSRVSKQSSRWMKVALAYQLDALQLSPRSRRTTRRPAMRKAKQTKLINVRKKDRRTRRQKQDTNWFGCFGCCDLEYRSSDSTPSSGPERQRMTRK